MEKCVVKQFLKLIALITVIMIFLCSCSPIDVKIEQPYETPLQSLSASPVPVITNTPDPTMTSPPTSTPIETVVPTAEPLLTI